MKLITKGNSFPGFMKAVIMVPALLMVSTLYAEVSKHDAEIENVRSGMNKVLKSGDISSITPSAVDGLYEVMVGPQLYYVTSDGKYLLNGKLFNIEKREDLTTPKISKAKAVYIESIGEDNMVIFAPEEYKHTITVFTDIDCGYCRKLHEEMKDYNDLGIRVRYMMYPRAGVGSESFQKAVSVLCADDRNEAMTLSKAGEEIPVKNCENPVRNHFQLGQLLGVTGTPAIFLQSGDMLPGYIPAKKMSSILNELDMELASRNGAESQ
ncbi:MAG: DsbC family protein [Candidatus Thiodiazotropha lotti]|uniref:Thiol:disulfide interchange protein n=1 Tax=Candidatus Thiodiazotropha lotti TaxID=2792787 RepID=A0A9E4K4Z4_9GAMM|nr:DsbC family protein [Candidatus Thiodiazotropha lotti]MCG7932693.1 DsbC family protein [Candidatus Thiodiazotropha lotti]MCG7938846.1 DsbC family protein [Candidatus Thiodiazotropha lotti]MCG7988484.1 DsbC family protein [Candidatus Thiodiazotropha lotti]MCG8004443.1 DsbC family protein [Candidatus Thiodiazotropha lotti]